MTKGKAAIIFKGAMTTTSDNELIDFLTEAKRGMSSWTSRLRFYQGITSELEYYELNNLTYDSIGMGATIDDIKVIFDYGHLRHYHCV